MSCHGATSIILKKAKTIILKQQQIKLTGLYPAAAFATMFYDLNSLVSYSGAAGRGSNM